MGAGVGEALRLVELRAGTVRSTSAENNSGAVFRTMARCSMSLPRQAYLRLPRNLFSTAALAYDDVDDGTLRCHLADTGLGQQELEVRVQWRA